NASNASGFVVNRSTDGVTFSQLAVLGNVTSYKDTGLSAGSKCYYEVAATNGAGTSAFSNVANATTTAAQSAPAAPSNLTATAVSTSEIDLAWQANSSNAASFRIQRSRDGIHFAYLASVGGKVTTYKDTGLTPGTTYYYRVRAHNTAGYSAPSNVATATTATPVNLAITTAAVTGGVSVNLNGSFADPDSSASDAHQVVINWG